MSVCAPCKMRQLARIGRPLAIAGPRSSRHGIHPLRLPSSPLTDGGSSRCSPLRPSRIDRRLFATTASRHDEKTPDPHSAGGSSQNPAAPAPTAEEIDTVVRQARQTFGDTLPRNFLSPEEYRQYERLYGPPLRETRPEDIGFRVPSDDAGDADYGGRYEAEARGEEDMLLEGDEGEVGAEGEGAGDGFVGELRDVVARLGQGDEQLEAAMQQVSPELLRELERRLMEPDEVGEEEAAEGDESSKIDGLQQDQEVGDMDYLSVIANNQREFDTLVKLRKDFERAAAEAQEGRDKAAEDVDEDDALSQEDQEESLDVFSAADNFDDDFASISVDDPASSLLYPPRERVERGHPYTRSGRFRTFPSTLQLPRATFVDPLARVLSDRGAGTRALKEAAEKAFGGPGLPDGPTSPPPTVLGRLQGGAQSLGGRQAGWGAPGLVQATHYHVGELEADAYVATVLPGMYASAMSALVEVRKRLGADWLRGLLKRRDSAGVAGPRVLDVGAGGAGLAAWRDVAQAEWASMHEGADGNEATARKDQRHLPPMPKGRSTVVVGSDTLRHRVSRFLQDTTFLPRLPDYVHSARHPSELDSGTALPRPRKAFDVIIASHQLLAQPEGHRRRAALSSLWALLEPRGGLLLLTEKGSPLGFEAVAEARADLLKEFIVSPGGSATPAAGEETDAARPGHQRTREPGLLVAPCTNHDPVCPLYKMPGRSQGRKDFCRFSQRYMKPMFQQKILLGATAHSSHADVEFSFVAVQRGGGTDLKAEESVVDGDLEEPTGADETSLPFRQGPAAADLAFAGYGRGKHEEPGAVAEWETDEGDSTTPVEVAGELEAASDVADVADLAPSPPPTPTPSPYPAPLPWQQPHALSLPRVLLPPMKRRGHVILDVCTPAATLERWVVPKSWGRQAYRDARKSQWGDLWALGAKTRLPRNSRVGVTAEKEGRRERKARGKKERKEGRRAAQEGMEEEEEEEEMAKLIQMPGVREMLRKTGM